MLVNHTLKIHEVRAGIPFEEARIAHADARDIHGSVRIIDFSVGEREGVTLGKHSAGQQDRAVGQETGGMVFTFGGQIGRPGEFVSGWIVKLSAGEWIVSGAPIALPARQ